MVAHRTIAHRIIAPTTSPIMLKRDVKSFYVLCKHVIACVIGFESFPAMAGVIGSGQQNTLLIKWSAKYFADHKICVFEVVDALRPHATVHCMEGVSSL